MCIWIGAKHPTDVADSCCVVGIGAEAVNVLGVPAAFQSVGFQKPRFETVQMEVRRHPYVYRSGVPPPPPPQTCPRTCRNELLGKTVPVNPASPWATIPGHGSCSVEFCRRYFCAKIATYPVVSVEIVEDGAPKKGGQAYSTLNEAVGAIFQKALETPDVAVECPVETWDAMQRHVKSVKAPQDSPPGNACPTRAAALACMADVCAKICPGVTGTGPMAAIKVSVGASADQGDPTIESLATI